MKCPTCSRSDYEIIGAGTHEYFSNEYEYRCNACGDEWVSPVQEPCKRDTFDETMLYFNSIF